MPKPKNKYDRQHLLHLQQLQRQIDEIYREATREAAAIGVTITDFNPDRPFTFDDYPLTRMRVESLMLRFKAAVEVAVVNGIESEWTLANNKNNELANRVFGRNVGRLTQEQYRRYYTTNEDARDAFIARKENGLTLSDRVWRYTGEFKEEIEMGLDLGIRGGLSADEMTSDLRKYLQHPDLLFRRVRDEHGILHLSKRAAQFHPGRGVYRSSYMNARRLAATEGNIAYRTSDHMRWQDMDFVVGIEIHLSNNHTCLGRDGKPHPFTDICDDLQGRYPKDFKFTGWHPHCRCYATSILKTDEEIARDTQRILNGEPLDGESVNRVDDVPQGFKDWLAANEERAATRYSVPYFIKDNMKYVPAELREAFASRMPYDTYEEYAKAMRYNQQHAHFSVPIRKNNAELSRLLPVVQGKIMNFTEADGGSGNPDYGIEKASELGFHHNCQTCTMAYELRRRGFDVEARQNPIAQGYKRAREFDRFCFSKHVKWTDRFLNADGTKADYAWSRTASLTDTPEAKRAFIYGKTREEGRYEVYCAWKGKDAGAHVFIVERTADGDLIWFDPQSGKKGRDIANYASSMMPASIGVLRIDDKIINPKFVSRLLKARK